MGGCASMGAYLEQIWRGRTNVGFEGDDRLGELL